MVPMLVVYLVLLLCCAYSFAAGPASKDIIKDINGQFSVRVNLKKKDP